MIVEKALIGAKRLLKSKGQCLSFENYRWREIEKTISVPEIAQIFSGNSNLPRGFGNLLDERIVEYPWFFSKMANAQGLKVLDAGSVLNFSNLLQTGFFKRNNVTIATLAPEKNSLYAHGVGHVFQDLRNTYFKSATFDVVVSLSTLEHVGMDNTVLYTKNVEFSEILENSFRAACIELRRICKPKGSIYISLPCGIFKNLGWLQIFGQEQLRILLDCFEGCKTSIEYFLHSEFGWERKESFSEVEHAKYSSRLTEMYGWRYDPFRPGAEAIACIEIQKGE
jgi:SAM-dependent methyltransferase